MNKYKFKKMINKVEKMIFSPLYKWGELIQGFNILIKKEKKMKKVRNLKNKLVCEIGPDSSIIIIGKGCKTILKPSKEVDYKIFSEIIDEK